MYYFLGDTMLGKSTAIRDLLLQQDELIAFQHAHGEIWQGVDEVVYFTGSDFDAIVHDPLEKSGVVFETKFPTPDNLDMLTGSKTASPEWWCWTIG